MRILKSLFNPQYFFVFLLFSYLLCFSLHAFLLGKTVYGDGVYYYSWLRSIVIDHDVFFTNEYKFLGGNQQITPLGLLGNVYPIGPPIFWFPFFITIHSFLRGDGFSLLYQLYIGTISVFYTVVGLVLLYRLLQRYFSESISLLTITTVAFATNIFFYGSIDTVNSHSISFFLATIVLTLILEKGSFFTIGLFSGFLALTRTQDAIILFIPFLELFANFLQFKRLSLRLSQLVLLFLGFFIAFIPQLITWQILYGTFTKSPYLDQYHFFDFLHPKITEVLFSTNNGLLLWTPAIGICFGGLFFISHKLKKYKLIFLFIFIVQLFLIASWSFWWQGASFSGRMFISIIPILTIGLASIFEKISKKIIIITIIIVCIYNMFSILFYLLSH